MKHLLLCLTIVLLFSCKHERFKNETALSQDDFQYCGVKDLPATLQNGRRKPLMSTINAFVIGGTQFVLFVNFNGGTYPGGVWGSHSPNPFPYAAWGGTGTEIPIILDKIREDYAWGNILVTSNVSDYNASSNGHRTQVNVAAGMDSLFGNVGGVALIGTASWVPSEPAWVIPNKLGYNSDQIAIAISHEAGHTLDLYHQSIWDASCNLVTAYNPGNGTGATSWGPLMGVPYGKGLSTFSSGKTSVAIGMPDCGFFQDNFAVLNTYIGYNADQDPDDRVQPAGSYRVLTDNGAPFDGVLGLPTDVDVIKFPSTYNAGSTFEVQTFGNVDVKVRLYNSSGTLKLTLDPSTTVYIPASSLTLLNVQNGFAVIEATAANTNVPSTAFLRGKWRAILH